jgi:hypothetical protein
MPALQGHAAKWSKEEDDLLISLVHQTPSSPKSRVHRPWADVAADMNVEAPRLGIHTRVYNRQKVMERWSKYLQTQHLQERREITQTASNLPSFKESMEHIDNTPLHIPLQLPPIQKGFKSLVKPSLPAQERKTQATGPPDEIIK